MRIAFLGTTRKRAYEARDHPCQRIAKVSTVERWTPHTTFRPSRAPMRAGRSRPSVSGRPTACFTCTSSGKQGLASLHFSKRSRFRTSPAGAAVPSLSNGNLNAQEGRPGRPFSFVLVTRSHFTAGTASPLIGHHKSDSTRFRYRTHGISLVRSHCAHVPSSTTSRRAASAIVQPIARRFANIRSPRVTGSGKGSYPRNCTIAGMNTIEGSVNSFSQFRTVSGLTSSNLAAAHGLSQRSP